MPQSTREPITLVGAGLAGSLMAVFLARRGFAVDVYERRPDMRATTISAGRSINLALSRRGLYALGQVGLEGDILALCLPMRGRMIHPVDGTPSLQPYGQRAGEVIYSVSRAGLNTRLMDAAESYEGVRFHFNTGAAAYDPGTGRLTLRDETSGRELATRPDRLLAADGAGSTVRMSMLQLPRYNYSQQFLTHGYKELTIPPGTGGAFRMEHDALHIWPRGTYMLIALPNLDGSFTCTLFMPFSGHPGFDDLTTEASVLGFFESRFPDAVPLMPTLLEDFFDNPVGPLGTVKCAPWSVGDQALLLGDAAHAIVPFFGQGMNCCFEDCTYLDACLDQHPGDWEAIFRKFQAMRKANTDAIADMAEANYLEMRDRVNDPAFVLQREVALALERRYPDVFIPLYSMVSFHRIPYAEARRRGVLQAELLATLCAGVSSADAVDWQRAGALIRHLPWAEEKI